jgi:tetratricopeptide (TPR) repeat protein
MTTGCCSSTIARSESGRTSGRLLSTTRFGSSTPSRLPQSSRYRPLSDVWYALQFHLFGLNPAGSHAAEIALHLAAVLIVFKVAERLTRDRIAALLACALFAVHPVHVQTVVWTAAIGLLLAGVLELGAFYLFIERARSRWRTAAALGLFALALLANEIAVALPALVGTYVFLLESPAAASSSPIESSDIRPRLRRAMIGAMPFAIVLVPYLLARRLALGFFVNGVFKGPPIGAAQLLMTLPRILATDLALLAAPSSTAFAHRQLIVSDPRSPDIVRSALAPDFYVPAACLILLVTAFGVSLRNHPRRRLYLFCAAWMVIAVAPMMDIRRAGIARTLLIQDDYLYLASVGWCVMLADWTVRLARAGSAARRNLVQAATVAMLAVYAGVLWRDEHLWHDEPTLFANCVRYFPESSACHSQLGVARKRAGDISGAESELETAVRLDPADGHALRELAKTHAMQGRIDQATHEMDRALKLTAWPLVSDYTMLAEFYDLDGQPAQSEATLKYAEGLPGAAQQPALARAQIRMIRGDNAGAEAILRDLAKRYPDEFEVWSELGAALADQKRYPDAIAAYGRAAQLRPDEPSPHIALAMIFHATAQDQQALAQCRRALAIDPDDERAQAIVAEIKPDPNRR